MSSSVAFEKDLVVAKNAYETICFLWTNLVCIVITEYFYIVLTYEFLGCSKGAICSRRRHCCR